MSINPETLICIILLRKLLKLYIFPKVRLQKFKAHNYTEGSVESVLLKGRYFCRTFLVHVGNIIRGIIMVSYDPVISGSPPQPTVSLKSLSW